MKSKRNRILSLLGVAAVSSGMLMAPELNAADSFVSEAGYVGATPAESPVQPVGFFDSGCDAAAGCDEIMGCDSSMDDMCGCVDGCQCDEGGGILGEMFECNLGEPFSLFGEACGISAGGWAQLGYHNKALSLFNAHPDNYNLHQMWLFAEKSLDTSNGFDYGGRVDYVYGVDAQDTQAFGIDNGHWDTDWDHGIYGHALPQAYGEVGYGDMSIKFGHFFTLIGYEVVAAPDNFFYSHAYTMYNSEPFTHSGALATVNVGDDFTLYAGWTLGWDSGFEDNGDSFLGGASVSLNENVSVTYATTAGRFSRSPDGDERGYMHSIVTDVTLTDRLQYISQHDLLTSENANGNTIRDTIGLNNYLIYTLNDCLAMGLRAEYWSVAADSAGYYGDNANLALIPPGFNPANEDFDIYQLTLGLNYKPHANILVRPEIRWDWVDGVDGALVAADVQPLEDGDDSQTTFGIDTIFLF